jgi:hypothetical protein
MLCIHGDPIGQVPKNQAAGALWPNALLAFRAGIAVNKYLQNYFASHDSHAFPKVGQSIGSLLRLAAWL